jgi:hypothetical protein
MKTYDLKSSGGETVNSIKADNIDIAIGLFSEIKKISPKSLLGIFIVSERVNEK